MRNLVFVLSFVSLLVSSCSVQRIPFPESEYSTCNLKGDKSVKGTVFLVDQLEERQVGAGSEVVLEPHTSYSEHWYQVSYLKNRRLKEPDPRYHKYIMRTKADDEGRFVFADVAPGNYMIRAPLYWEAVTCSANVVKTRVDICKKITVREDDTVVEIALTKEYQSPAMVCDLYTQGAWEKEKR